MEAGRIKDIVRELDKLPYKCIMFDGVWGVGKTYAVDEVLDEQKNCCKISMFGLQNSQQIYHEIICRLTRWKHLPNISKKIDKISNCLSQVSDKANTTKELLYGFIDEKELFAIFSQGFRTWHYIVIDDLERMSSDINLEEIMGVVEELKKCSYVKVIILVNKNEMSDAAKDILQKYEEKVIDRIYHITEIPSKINWGNLGVHAFFIKKLLEQWEKNLDAIVAIGELNSTTDAYIHYSKVLDEDYSLFLERYEKRLYIIMTETVSSGNEIILSYSADVLDISSEEIKKIYNKVRAIVREELIVSYIDNLCNLAISDRKAFEYSYELRKCYENNKGKTILQKHLDKLYNIKFFPVTDMSDDKRYTCYNVMSILYRADSDRFLEYCDGIECDRMARYRMEKLVEEIVRNFKISV